MPVMRRYRYTGSFLEITAHCQDGFFISLPEILVQWKVAVEIQLAAVALRANFQLKIQYILGLRHFQTKHGILPIQCAVEGKQMEVIGALEEDDEVMVEAYGLFMRKKSAAGRIRSYCSMKLKKRIRTYSTFFSRFWKTVS